MQNPTEKEIVENKNSMHTQHLLSNIVKQKIESESSGQKFEEDGRIHIPKKAWIIRFVTIFSLIGIISYNIFWGIRTQDPYVLYAGIMVVDALIMVSVGWLFYKIPKQGLAGNKLVSVLIPVYNQKNMISIVIDSIANSTYKNIEIIAVDDGSIDGTGEILDDLSKKYPTLRVFHKKNEGKRKTNFLGFSKSRGKFIVFLDSDSVLDHRAIEEMMKTFNVNPDTGALVGEVKAWNGKKTLLTKSQDAWYDFEFNILKGTQSSLYSVLCCSGAFTMYRREAIEKFIPLWNGEKTDWDNLDTKKYFNKNPWKNRIFGKISLKILEWASQYDDAEDIVLTMQSLVDWRTQYVASSIAYTDVPEGMAGFLKQQLRWRKGWLRGAFFGATHIWKKNPLVSIMFYINLLTIIPAPVILISMIFYSPFVLHQYLIPLTFFAGLVGLGFAHGLDYKIRDPKSTTWKYRPVMNILLTFIFPWLTIPALLTFRKSQWLTR